MDLGISGRTALVTGGDSGTGWHTAQLLLHESATVVAFLCSDRVSLVDGSSCRVDSGSVATI